ncbi:calcium-binding protein [Microvirga sp. CF3062]|uniref:calcium-binding protein n=1 Tax=Microvirga sp. CF3062 TaxID=3110182 RepID=UPI002E777A26|nr:calcium-binding protein [Microvirga sp. CF3062]MEE1655085.1 calcium-binding protein [Microvirga sp. CF3062]
MAAIYGDDFDETIEGFDSSDTIYGYDGNNLIYGWDGHDDIFGGWDHDTIDGGFGDDYLIGGAGHDDLYGGDGWDDLYGGSGLDYLSGGFGEDLLSGGTGRDTLAGGAGEDEFLFKKGDSGVTSSTADTITDWNRSFDFIDMTIKGTRSNYREVKTDAASIATAASDADFLYGDTNVRHVFLYNPKTDKGFLISDLNADGYFDTGIVLKSAGFASDMRYDYII